MRAGMLRRTRPQALININELANSFSVIFTARCSAERGFTSVCLPVCDAGVGVKWSLYFWFFENNICQGSSLPDGGKAPIYAEAIIPVCQVEWGWADNTRHRAISLRQQGFLVNRW